MHAFSAEANTTGTLLLIHGTAKVFRAWHNFTLVYAVVQADDPGFEFCSSYAFPCD